MTLYRAIPPCSSFLSARKTYALVTKKREKFIPGELSISNQSTESGNGMENARQWSRVARFNGRKLNFETLKIVFTLIRYSRLNPARGDWASAPRRRRFDHCRAMNRSKFSRILYLNLFRSGIVPWKQLAWASNGYARFPSFSLSRITMKVL